VKDMVNRGYFRKLGAKFVGELDYADECTDECGEDGEGLDDEEECLENGDDEECDEDELEQLSAALSCHSSGKKWSVFRVL
jgi:hypothetical protein